MKSLITLVLSIWVLCTNAQKPLYEIKNKGSTVNYATGTQTVITGRVYADVNGITKPVKAEVTIKGYDKEIQLNENGFYFVEISEVIKTQKKLTVYCKAKNYKTQKAEFKAPFTNQYQMNFEMVPEGK